MFFTSRRKKNRFSLTRAALLQWLSTFLLLCLSRTFNSSSRSLDLRERINIHNNNDDGLKEHHHQRRRRHGWDDEHVNFLNFEGKMFLVHWTMRKSSAHNSCAVAMFMVSAKSTARSSISSTWHTLDCQEHQIRINYKFSSLSSNFFECGGREQRVWIVKEPQDAFM